MAEELNLPALNTQTPEAARAAAKERTANAPRELEDVASIRDTEVPAPVATFRYASTRRLKATTTR